MQEMEGEYMGKRPLTDTINKICIDTRKIEENSLYIPIIGENFDGHNFIDQALLSGAKISLSQRKDMNYKTNEIIIVDDTRQALLDLASYYRSLFSLATVGVTGSVGKTSTKEMIYTILNAKAKTIKTLGNFNNEIGMPLTMFRLEKEYKYGVFEMGMSSFGEISKLSKVCRPNMSIITNIGVSHIENLKTQDNILKAKLEILDGMESDAPLILNADDEYLKNVDTQTEHPVIYYAINNLSADVRATNIKKENMQTTFEICYFGKTIKAQIPTVGIHNVMNALAGFCVGLVAQINPQQIVDAMKWYKNDGMRQNFSNVDGIIVIKDCYNASPDSMNSAIDTITSIDCKGKRVCVFGDMLELGDFSNEAHLEVGKNVARANIDLLICYGEKSSEIKRGAVMVGMKNVVYFTDKVLLKEYISENLQKGDAIIYKASRGMKLEEIAITAEE
ncbi:MAG: UDP-N-acetylmuramoyl-tripeptide--D-alanyl-D-alanine ligase [Oscillospiraceae bacterium]